MWTCLYCSKSTAVTWETPESLKELGSWIFSRTPMNGSDAVKVLGLEVSWLRKQDEPKPD